VRAPSLGRDARRSADSPLRGLAPRGKGATAPPGRQRVVRGGALNSGLNVGRIAARYEGNPMDARHFDTLARSLTEAGTRRGLLGLLATLPVLGSLVARLDFDEVDAKGRRKRRKKRHKHGKGNGRHRMGKRKPKCKDQSNARTCANHCGVVKTRCGKRVDCGSCVCEPTCPICQVCNETAGACEPDTSQLGDDCGQAGQRCQPDGACACDAGSCAPCETCKANGACSSPCDGEGCCDEGDCVSGFDDGTCGRNGQPCVACTLPETCGGGGTPNTCGCTPRTTCPPGTDCGMIDDGCWGQVRCGPDVCQHSGTECQQTVCQGNVCTTQNLPISTPCDDGDPCTTGSTCTAGTCGGGSTVCTSPPACRTAVGATCSGGGCTYPLAAAGTPCDSVPCGVCDSSGACLGCTSPETCVGGACRSVAGTCAAGQQTCVSGWIACNSDNDCTCDTTLDGVPACRKPMTCRACTSNADCGANHVCLQCEDCFSGTSCAAVCPD
jgi:hypothetical protein